MRSMRIMFGWRPLFAGVAEEGRACPYGTLGLGAGGFQCESRIRRWSRNTSDIVRYGAGFYLWYAAFAVATIGTFAERIRKKSRISGRRDKMTFDEWLGLSKLLKNEARMLLLYASEYTRVQLLDAEAVKKCRTKSDSGRTGWRNAVWTASFVCNYLLGWRGFFGGRFAVGPYVLISRLETEHLVEAVLAAPLPENGRVWDLGTGSGAVAM